MKSKRLHKIITVFIPAFIIFLIIIKEAILSLTPYFPICTFYRFYRHYCPSCGNTRSVTALLHGDLLTSLRFNVVPILSILLLIPAYIELATYSFGKHIRILPRKLSFYMTIITLLIIYFFARNLSPYLTP